MKNLRFILIIVLISLSYNNGIIAKDNFRPGKLWFDTSKKIINAHGGGILKYNGIYYWFGEHKAENTNNATVGINCYSSKNLLDWNYCGVALSVSDKVGNDIENGCIMERPKVVFNKKTNTFVMWFHLELKGKGYATAAYGVATSDNPSGPYTYKGHSRANAGLYPVEMNKMDISVLDTLNIKNYPVWWTPTWREAVKKGLFLKRDFTVGQMARDQTIFVDDDNKAYHIFSSEDNLTIHIAELTDDYLNHTGRYTRVAAGGQNEAPTIFKRDGIYWMITSGCTGWSPNAARLFKANCIWGPWTQLGNPCIGDNANTTFDGQGTYILKIDDKDNYIFMADKWRPDNPIDGRYIWLPIQFKDNQPFIEWKDSWNLHFFEKK